MARPQDVAGAHAEFASQSHFARQSQTTLRFPERAPASPQLKQQTPTLPQLTTFNDALTPHHSTVHPPLDDIEALDEYIQGDPSNVIQIIPALTRLIEEHCIRSPIHCKDIWEDKLKPLLVDLQEMSKPADIIPRPPSPVCPRKPHKWVNVHGEEWEDDYAWLTDKENPEVLQYIEQENEYTTKMLDDTKPLQKLLYKEFVSRIDECEMSAKVTMQDGWTYYIRKEVGKEYRLHCRSKNDLEEVYLDENILANSPEFEDASYFRMGFLKHSPDCKLIAYGIDSVGNERYTTYFMKMDTKTVLDDRIEGVYEDLEFADDNSVFYTVLDDCERAYHLKRHKLNDDVSNDALLYHEDDEMFFLSLTKSCNGRYIILNSSAQITSESRFISADSPNDPPRLIFARQENIQYSVEAHGSYFYILTNENSKNNCLYRTPIPTTLPDPAAVTEKELLDLRETVVEQRDFVLIEDFEVRRNHLIVFERSNCLQNVRIVDLRHEGFTSYHYISFGEMVYSLWPGLVREEERSLAKASQFDTNILRFTYTSFVQPKQVIDYNMDDRTMDVIHEEHIGGYEQSLYTSRRLFATGVDGTAVPVSIVYRRDLLGLNQNPSQPNPCLLHAYGAYGAFVNPIFSGSRLSLLDRGFIYAAAHVRGGADMGNGWYEEGKLGKKPNTFLDFCSVAEYLCKEGYTTPSKLSIYGRSAGGLLIGAAINIRPDLFAAALTEVPFVDVINTMFDASIPWTAFEYEEWGNPNEKEIYEVMKTYCPYSNIRGLALARNAYPHLLVVAGMNDPRVAFFEPLKFVAKMRGERRRALKNSLSSAKLQFSNAEKRDSGPVSANSEHGGATPAAHTPRKAPTLAAMAGGPVNDLLLPAHPTPRSLLLRLEDAGHGGSSGQYTFLENLAFEYAFLITALNADSPSAAAMMPSPSGTGFTFSDGHDEQDQEGNAGGRSRRHKRGAIDSAVEEKEYRRRAKGDRGPSNVFQWVSNLF
ncbi:prolyl oligopeptidase [Phlyctochytrium arcticum]|nr:prolyl oligopeptidase [Phlyctochytrium arcticum]